MKLTRSFLWHWHVDSPSSVWLADAELDLSKFSAAVAVSFTTDAVIASSARLDVAVSTGGSAETTGSTLLASSSTTGPLTGPIAGANVAGVDPSQGKILLHLSASVTSDSAEVRNIVLTLSDE